MIGFTAPDGLQQRRSRHILAAVQGGTKPRSRENQLATVMATFWAGGEAYNIAAFVVSLAGAVITLGGFALAVHHIIEAKSSADSAKTSADQAKEAAKNTAGQMQKMGVLVNVQKLCTLCAEAIVQLENRDLGSTALRCSDLRVGIVQIKILGTPGVKTKTDWQQMMLLVISVQDALREPDCSDNSSSRCLDILSRVRDDLEGTSAKASRGFSEK